jgi:exodeoxyribonuclease-5
MSIIYSEGQRKAIHIIIDFFRGVLDKQLITIAGYAGTGKSTIIMGALDEAGVNIEEVAFVAFTGKAALVLRRKGCPNASTIHKICYELKESQECINPQQVASGKEEAKYRTVMKFVKRAELPDPRIKVIVVDECSMVTAEMLQDLMSFGAQLILLGDPGQLPPVEKDEDRKKGSSWAVASQGKTGTDYLKSPDVFLTEIHRQAEGDPIIHLSFLARTGGFIDFGRYGEKAAVIRKNELALIDKCIVKAGQILVTKHDDRHLYNRRMRHLLGKDECILPDAGDKLVCRRNNWQTSIGGATDLSNDAYSAFMEAYADSGYGSVEEWTQSPEYQQYRAERDAVKVVSSGREVLPLINGLIGHAVNPVMDDDVDEGKRTMLLDFQPEGREDYFKGLVVDLNTFDPLPDSADFHRRSNYLGDTMINQFDFGYALTVHTSQGSEWDNVFFHYSPWGDADMRKKMLYTAITRASKRFIMAK